MLPTRWTVLMSFYLTSILQVGLGDARQSSKVASASKAVVKPIYQFNFAPPIASYSSSASRGPRASATIWEDVQAERSRRLVEEEDAVDRPEPASSEDATAAHDEQGLIGKILDDLMPLQKTRMLLMLMDLGALTSDVAADEEPYRVSTSCDKVKYERACSARERVSACKDRVCHCSIEHLVDLGICSHCIATRAGSNALENELNWAYEELLQECNAPEIQVILARAL